VHEIILTSIDVIYRELTMGLFGCVTDNAAQLEVGNLPTPSYFKEYAPRKWKNPINMNDRPSSSLEDDRCVCTSATLQE